MDHAEKLGISELKTLQDQSNLEDLRIVIRSFINGDAKFKKSLAANTNLFINYVTEEICGGNQVGLRWGVLIFRFEWKVTMLEFLNAQGLEQSVIDSVMELTKQYPLKFGTDLLGKTDLTAFDKESFLAEI